MHAWLAPFTPGSNHFIYIDLLAPTCISMIRIFNYNKSRIHSHRGARYVEICMDDGGEGEGENGSSDRMIFKGEIKKASVDDPIESIIFTRDEAILHTIDTYTEEEETYQMKQMKPRVEKQSESDDGETRTQRLNTWTTHDRPSTGADRPSTATGSKQRESEIFSPPPPDTDMTQPPAPSVDQEDHLNLIVGGSQKDLVKRGMARQLVRNKSFVNKSTSKEDGNRIKEQEVIMRPSTAPMRRQWKGRKGRHLELVFTKNWGGVGGMGLTGIQVLDTNFQPFLLEGDALRGAGYGLQNLINGVNVTAEPEEMWSTDFDNEEILLYIDLGKESMVGGLKIWNYNGGSEETYFGVKAMTVHLDGKLVTTGATVRKAPGFASFDFGQFIPLKVNEDDADATAHLFSGAISPKRKNKGKPRPDWDDESVDLWIKDDDDEINLSPDSSNNLDQSNNSWMLSSLQGPPRGTCEVPQQYETPVFPCGCILKVNIFTTHGDLFYVGLNGLAFFNEHNQPIKLSEEVRSAHTNSCSLRGTVGSERVVCAIHSAISACAT